jgi:hypothetical protein
LFARACDGCNQPGFRLDLANAVIPRICDQHVTIGPHRETVGSIEPGLGGWAAITAIPFFGTAGHSADHAGAIQFAQTISGHLNDVKVTGAVEPDAKRAIQFRFNGGRGEGLRPATRDDHYPGRGGRLAQGKPGNEQCGMGEKSR